MTDRADVTRRLLAVVTLGKRIAEVEMALRAQAGEVFTKVGQREVGDLGAAGDLGTVQLDSGATTWHVVDPDALQAFVASRFPEQLETVVRVRPAYVTALLTQAKSVGVAVTQDGEPIPGVDVATGDPKVVVKAAKDAGDVLTRAVADGFVSLNASGIAFLTALEAAS